MKKILILSTLFFAGLNGFAQRAGLLHSEPVQAYVPENSFYFNNRAAARTTGFGDTVTLSHIAGTDTTTIYRLGSGGYTTGTNAWNDKAFAERYDITGADSSVTILGVFALFSGKVSATSSQRVILKAWNQSAPVAITGSMYYNGFPGTVLDTVSAPVTQLGIGPVNDTLKQFMFATPSALLTGSFFVGYSIDYNYASLAGDTLGLAGTLNGHRTPAAGYTLVYNPSTADTTLDTVVNVQNATLGYDNRWYDNYTQNDSIKNNLAIYPIVRITAPSSVHGITTRALTLYGSYPNPANDVLNIRLALAHATPVTVTIMNMAGQTITTTTAQGTAGEQTIKMQTALLPAGDYLYLIRTSDGGIAGKFTKTR